MAHNSTLVELIASVDDNLCGAITETKNFFRLVALVMIRNSVKSLERNLGSLWSMIDLEHGHDPDTGPGEVPGDTSEHGHTANNVHCNGNTNTFCDL